MPEVAIYVKDSPAPRHCIISVDQDASQDGPADVDAFSFAEQLREMSMVGSLVNRARQVNYPALLDITARVQASRREPTAQLPRH